MEEQADRRGKQNCKHIYSLIGQKVILRGGRMAITSIIRGRIKLEGNKHTWALSRGHGWCPKERRRKWTKGKLKPVQITPTSLLPNQWQARKSHVGVRGPIGHKIHAYGAVSKKRRQSLVELNIMFWESLIICILEREAADWERIMETLIFVIISRG